MTKSLWRELFIPLFVIFAVSIILHWWLGWDGFFINLSTEVIGIVVTIGYVDYILKKYEKKEWQIPHSRVIKRLQYFVNRSINDCLYSLQYSYDFSEWVKTIRDFSGFSQDDFSTKFHSELLSVVKIKLKKDAVVTISNFDNEKWEHFVKHIESIHDSAEAFLLSFGDKLTPEQYTLVLDIQDTAESVLIMRETIYKNILSPLKVAAETPENIEIVKVMTRHYDEDIVSRLSTLTEMLEKLFKIAA
ncbi:MAG TPA: hypothetical protein DCS67_00520 [Clostridiales bacterium UBA8960]|jgi:hypothetical protein|nr:hypothetical protein [Clostridiales bacterium UBA8960]